MKRNILALLALVAVSAQLEARRCFKRSCANKEVVASCDPEPCCIKTVTVKKPAIRQCHYTWVCPEGYESNGTMSEHESK